MKKAIGIDIGGAHVKIGIVDEDGNLEGKTWIACNGKTREEIRKESVHRIETYMQKDKDILGIGRGCPGSIDSQHGIVLYSNNLKRKNIPRKDLLEKTTGLKTRITNDANAAVLGEWRFGKARGRKNVVLLTLGTGLGSGIIVNGTPLDELSDDLLDFVLDIASGKKSKSEEAGFHDMAIFKQGVTL